VLSVNQRWLEILLTPMRDQITVAETCRRYGISRQTFYVYQRRLYADGVTALAPLSRRPLTSPAQTGIEIEAEIVRLRTANPPLGRPHHPHPSGAFRSADRSGRIDDSSCTATQFTHHSAHQASLSTRVAPLRTLRTE
jgi:hypothetical protein